MRIIVTMTPKKTLKQKLKYPIATAVKTYNIVIKSLTRLLKSNVNAKKNKQVGKKIIMFSCKHNTETRKNCKG